MHDNYFTEVDFYTLYKELSNFTQYLSECYEEADDTTSREISEVADSTAVLIDYLERIYDCGKE